MSKGKWISVEDYLPEPHIEVLVTNGNNIEMKYLIPDDGIHCWGWYPGGWSIENTTHWRLLPEMPK